MSNALGTALLDSGASHNFLSYQFAIEARIPFRRGAAEDVVLADGSKLAVRGIAVGAKLRLDAHHSKHDFYVIDLPDFDIVWGMQFLHQTEPNVQWKHRTMVFPSASGPVTVSAMRERDRVAHSHGHELHLCSLSTFITQNKSHAHCFVGCVKPSASDTESAVFGKGRDAIGHCTSAA